MRGYKGARALGRRSTLLDHVLHDAGLSDLEAELEQLAMGARRSRQRIFRAHPHRFAVNLQGGGISNASTDASRRDASG